MILVNSVRPEPVVNPNRSNLSSLEHLTTEVKSLCRTVGCNVGGQAIRNEAGCVDTASLALRALERGRASVAGLARVRAEVRGSPLDAVVECIRFTTGTERPPQVPVGRFGDHHHVRRVADTAERLRGSCNAASAVGVRSSCSHVAVACDAVELNLHATRKLGLSPLVVTAVSSGCLTVGSSHRRHTKVLRSLELNVSYRARRSLALRVEHEVPVLHVRLRSVLPHDVHVVGGDLSKRGAVVEVRCIHQGRKTGLLDVAQEGHVLGGLASLREHREQDRSENRDDRDNHEKFNKRKCFF